MVSDERMAEELEGTLDRTDFVDVGRHQGKVRDSYIADGVRTIVTTDRQSAFDRVLGTIPFKGQALNAIANFWFDADSRHRAEPPARDARSERRSSPRMRPRRARVRRPRLHHGCDEDVAVVQLRIRAARGRGHRTPGWSEEERAVGRADTHSDHEARGARPQRQSSRRGQRRPDHGRDCSTESQG